MSSLWLILNHGRGRSSKNCGIDFYKEERESLTVYEVVAWWLLKRAETFACGHRRFPPQEIKKLKFDEAHRLQKRGNEYQYRFNLKISDPIEEAKDARSACQFDKVHASLEKGEKLLTERQKHILLADKSDFGWSLIREYKRNDLAEDSDNEKKIIRAEARAHNQAKQSERFKSRQTNRRDPTALTSVAAAASSQCSGKPIPIAQPRTPQAKPGSCFACNKPGHWRAQCPYTAKSTTGQWLAADDPEYFQGVVNSIVPNSSSDISDDDLSNSDHPDKAVEIRSLLNYEFTSGQ